MRYDDAAFPKSRTKEAELLVTDTILQTMGLQGLQICSGTRFSAAAVVAWLLHAGHSLRYLTDNIPTSTLYVNVLERCGRMKRLRSLDLSNTDISFTVDPTAQRFPCLLSTSLTEIEATEAQLQSLVSACKKLQSLSVCCVSFPAGEILKLTSSSLKSLVLTEMNLKSVITKAKLLEDLYLRDSGYNDVKLVKGGAKLRTLVIRETYIPILCFGD
jgi:anion-transporting  ArsA/GET3 family ATPase